MSSKHCSSWHASMPKIIQQKLLAGHHHNATIRKAIDVSRLTQAPPPNDHQNIWSPSPGCLLEIWVTWKLEIKSAYSSSYTLTGSVMFSQKWPQLVRDTSASWQDSIFPVFYWLRGLEEEQQCTCSSHWRVPGQSGVLCLWVCPHVISFPRRDLPQNWHLVLKMDTLW